MLHSPPLFAIIYISTFKFTRGRHHNFSLHSKYIGRKYLIKTVETNNETNNELKETNNKLRKTNENLTQLWATAKNALTKATNNEQSIKNMKSELQKTSEKLMQLWVTAKEEVLAKAISNARSTQEVKASNDFIYENIKDELSKQHKTELQKIMVDMK